MNDLIADTLGLTPISEIRAGEIASNNVAENEQFDADFEFARGNLIAIIGKGQEALSGIVDLAGMSQHPRSYEVVATLVKAMADANKDLLELQKRKRDLTGVSPAGPTTVNNNLFVGSTTELQQLIKKQHNESNQ